MKQKETDPIKHPRSSYNLRGHPSLFSDRDYLFVIKELEAHFLNYKQMVELKVKASVLASTAQSIKNTKHYLNIVLENLRCQYGIEHVAKLKRYITKLKQTNQWNDYVLPTGMIKELQ
jgi:hypothetical protein